jgi:hypothetical protein
MTVQKSPRDPSITTQLDEVAAPSVPAYVPATFKAPKALGPKAKKTKTKLPAGV